jgi:hypothetical protein
MTVADFGCGDARLAATVKQVGGGIHASIFSCPGVIACHMADTPLTHTPLNI